jgi:hypothetical protein
MRSVGRIRIVAGALVAIAGLAIATSVAAETTIVTYTATVTIPVPPSSNFAGSAGGDGWDVALTPTAVYNVFHHNSSALQLACHKQVDASKCWDTDSKVITDGSGNNFTGSSHPGLHLDQATGKLYIYTTRTSDNTAGVVCADTTQDPTNLFCGFTPLSAVGDGGITSIPMKVGTNLYSFNYVTGTTSAGGTGGTANTLLCFSLTSFGACAGQPTTVAVGAGTFSTGTFPVPATAAIGGKVLVPAALDGTSDVMGCFDPAAGAACAGSWPIAMPAGYIGGDGSPFPLLDAAGATIGFCLPTGTNPCFDLTGASVATPAGMPAVIGANEPWNGPAVTIGARVYVANGTSDEVSCFNYATGATCANFPKPTVDASYLYTVNPDPQRPACLWVNADNGSAQIQNFDAFSGAGCGQGAIRVLSASFVAPSQLCAPTQWRSLAVTTPTRDLYASGSVDFQDADANAIPGVGTQPLDAAGAIDLSPLALTTTLPQFLISLEGLTGTLGEVVVTLTWDAVYDPTCVSGVVSAQAPVAPTTVPEPGVTTTVAPPVTTLQPVGILPPTGRSSGPLAGTALAMIVVGSGLVILSVRNRMVR